MNETEATCRASPFAVGQENSLRGLRALWAAAPRSHCLASEDPPEREGELPWRRVAQVLDLPEVAAGGLDRVPARQECNARNDGRDEAAQDTDRRRGDRPGGSGFTIGSGQSHVGPLAAAPCARRVP